MPQMFPMPITMLFLSLMLLFFLSMVRIFWGWFSVKKPSFKGEFMLKSQFVNQTW